MNSWQIHRMEADVLVIGGGIAGLLAAIHAAHDGTNVIVLEKSNTRRSGSAGSGIDHLSGYIPPLHHMVGYTEEQMISEQMGKTAEDRKLCRRDLVEFFVHHSYEYITELEKYGIRFRFEDSDIPGGFRVVPQFHSVPSSFNFEGRDIKPKLTQAAEEAGVHIINRACVTEILTKDGAAVGAIAFHTRNCEIYSVRAKTVTLATSGYYNRIAQNHLANGFERFFAPSSSVGAGKVLAAKAGAEVVNLEFSLQIPSYSFQNYSFFSGAPYGSFWPMGRVIDSNGNVVIGRTERFSPDTPNYCEKYCEQVKQYAAGQRMMIQRLKAGETLYFDLTEATDEEIEYVKWTLSHEGKIGLINRNFQRDHVDWKKIRIPLRIGPCGSSWHNGIRVVDSSCETGVNNLYAAGIEIAGVGKCGASVSVVFGAQAGKQAARRARETVLTNVDTGEAEEHLLLRIRTLTDGSGKGKWQSAERALQELMEVYTRQAYSTHRIGEALQRLERIEENMDLHADDAHELTRCMEVQDMLFLCRMILMSAGVRQNSYGIYRREDSNPDLLDPAEVAVRVQDNRLIAYGRDEI